MRAWAWLPALALLTACGDHRDKRLQASNDVPAEMMARSATAGAQPQQCDAKTLAWLVGKPRRDIPVPVEPSSRRVSCTTCPMADDFRPDRTQIQFDRQTDLVVSVTCG